MTGEPGIDGELSTEDEPDAFVRGWIERSGGARDIALFVLSGSSLCVTDLDDHGSAEWYDLRDVSGLDALGDAVDGLQPVELTLSGDRILSAGWSEDFCAQVVGALTATLSTGPTAPVAPSDQRAPAAPSASTTAVAGAPLADAPAATSSQGAPAAAAAASTATTSSGPRSDEAPTGPDGAALVLEDVTYLGGYPGQARKRKRCTATLTRESVEIAAPNGGGFKVAWATVRTLEAQNADEARFRMNTKIHRDATALVFECEQDVTLLLEARDCPTVPLRGAIAQLVDDLPVVVV